MRLVEIVLGCPPGKWSHQVVLSSGPVEWSCRVVLSSGPVEWSCRVVLSGGPVLSSAVVSTTVFPLAVLWSAVWMIDCYKTIITLNDTS
jgi:hypothetical protein